MKKDPFALLGLPVAFYLDEKMLDDYYRRAQERCHPDAQGSFLAQKAVQTLSIEINWAYQKLRCPLERARFFLISHGYNPCQTTPYEMQEIWNRLEISLDQKTLSGDILTLWDDFRRAMDYNDLKQAQIIYATLYYFSKNKGG